MQAGPPPEFWVGFFVCIAIVFAVVLIIQIFFLLTLMRTQKEVAERNRELSPGMVWLTLIPLFGMIWVLIMVPKLSNSLRREFEDRGWRTEGEGFARATGMIWAFGGLVNTFLSVLQNVAQFGGQMEVAMLLSVLSLPIGLTILVCWIMYWVQMAQYGRRLREDGPRYAPGSTEADYDDEYRPRRDGDDYDRPRREDDDYDRPRRNEDYDRPR